MELITYDTSPAIDCCAQALLHVDLSILKIGCKILLTTPFLAVKKKEKGDQIRGIKYRILSVQRAETYR
jgi:hypothetical protein